MTEADEKQTLHRYLRNARGVLLWKLEGLSDYDIRRPKHRCNRARKTDVDSGCTTSGEAAGS